MHVNNNACSMTDFRIGEAESRAACQMHLFGHTSKIMNC